MAVKQDHRQTIEQLRKRLSINNTVILVLCAIIIFLSLQVAYFSNRRQELQDQNNKLNAQLSQGTFEAYAKDRVYEVCNKSRVSPSITEAECGELQDRYNMEFLCEQSNALPSNKCWVEVR